MGRAVYGIRITALLLVLGALAGGCDGGGGDGVSPRPSPTAITRATSPTPTGAPTPTSPPPASEQPPDRDLIDLARRFRGLPPDTARTARESPFGYRLGDREEFTILDVATPSVG